MDTYHHGAVPNLAAPELAHHDHIHLAPMGSAAPHAVVTPTNEEDPNAAIVRGATRTETRGLVFEQLADDGKQFATLREHLALKGYSLNRTAVSDGPVCFYITRWGMVRELRDLTAVARFLGQMGGSHA